jgi:O-antigen/teichoic acid export membrane protein
VGQLAGLSLALLWLRGEIFNGSGRSSYIRDCLGYGWKSHLSNILAFLNYRIDIFLVNGFLNPAAVGVYVVAVQIAERLWILSQAVSTVLLPRLAELDDDESARTKLTPLIGRWVLFATTLVTIVVAIFSQPLITVLFGEVYAEAVGVLLWLLPGVALGSLSRVLSNDLAARGRPELNLYTAAVVVLVNVMLNLLLIPQMGIEGAALATTIAYTVNAILKIYAYRRLSNNLWFAPLIPSRADLAYAKLALKHAARLLPRR